jgi:Cu/Ag efflux protein CusF
LSSTAAVKSKSKNSTAQIPAVRAICRRQGTKESSVMTKSAVLALAVVLLPGVALCSPTSDEQQAGVANTQGAAIAAKPATASVRGMVASVDQRNDTIAIRRASDNTEQFRVQDGLLFDSVRYGDQVEITVQNIAGAKTIVGLRQQ